MVGRLFVETDTSVEQVDESLDENQEQNLAEPESKEEYLPKEVLEEFMKNFRNEIVKEGGIDIAYINNQLVYPPRNNLDNYIIVSISCTFCVALIIFNLICQRK